MNILFLSLLDFENIEEHNIYTDLLRKFYQEGHRISVVSPVERRKNITTHLSVTDDRLKILKLKIGNIQKTNLIEKGISTLTIENAFINGVKRYFSLEKYDLVLYTTPPITLQRVVQYVKKRDGALAYLMLKDIFPQNAVDLGMLKKKGIIYKYFRYKEKILYKNSDFIGCMSEANAAYLKKQNPDIPNEKIEICPNAIEPTENNLSECEKIELIKKYGIPKQKMIFVYGGNLGKPQGISFINKFISEIEKLDNVFVLIIGSGTEYVTLKNHIEKQYVKNTKLFKYVPKQEFDKLLRICDVGLVFLDWNFTIPNIPSRLLAYMDAKLPVYAITDRATDIGEIIVNGNFGWKGYSDDLEGSVLTMSEISKSRDAKQYGENAKKYLQNNYSVDVVYNNLIKHWG